MGIGEMMSMGEVNLADNETSISEAPFYYPILEKTIMDSQWVRRARQFSPSMLKPCVRCSFLFLVGYDFGSADLKGRKRMDAGTSIHTKWEEMIMKSGIPATVKRRVFIDEPLRISGEPDAVILNLKKKLFHLIELKSKDTYAFKNGAKPTWSNRAQWQVYCWMLKQEGLYTPRDIDSGWIQMEEMNWQDWRAFPQIYDEKWTTDYIQGLIDVQTEYDKGEKGTIPEPRQVKRGVKRVKYIECPDCTKMIEEQGEPVVISGMWFPGNRVAV